MSHRPPADVRPLNFRRAIVLLLTAAILVATLFGWIAQRSAPQRIPMDTGTPSIVTTIGGSK